VPGGAFAFLPKFKSLDGAPLAAISTQIICFFAGAATAFVAVFYPFGPAAAITSSHFSLKLGNRSLHPLFIGHVFLRAFFGKKEVKSEV
jgi:hypothetical protein